MFDVFYCWLNSIYSYCIVQRAQYLGGALISSIGMCCAIVIDPQLKGLGSLAASQQLDLTATKHKGVPKLNIMHMVEV